MCKCDTCYFCSSINGKCKKRHKKPCKKCKDYSKSSIKTNFYDKD